MKCIIKNYLFMNKSLLNISFVILFIGTIFLLLGSNLFSRGMFLDGVTYATISRNLSEGIGSFWHPRYTDVLYPDFHEHPPLVFGIQSLFFKLFGDHYYTEKIYSFTTYLTVLLSIAWCWNLLIKTPNRGILWPLFIFTTTPIIFWSFKNNMLENTMLIFLLLNCIFFFYGLRNKKTYWCIGGAMALLSGFLCKGPVALFPIIAPLIWGGLFQQDLKFCIKYFFLQFFTFISLFFFIFHFIPESKVNIQYYLDTQLFPALSNRREVTVNNRLTILVQLLTELILPLLGFLIISLVPSFRKFKIDKENLRKSLFFLLIGFCGSVPLIISMKQSRYYLVPSIAFFSIGLAIFFCYKLNDLKIRNSRYYSIFNLSLSCILIAISVIHIEQTAGKPSRDNLLISDVDFIVKSIKERDTLEAPQHLCTNWPLVAYLYREGKINIDQNKHPFKLSESVKKDSTKNTTRVLNFFELN